MRVSGIPRMLEQPRKTCFHNLMYHTSLAVFEHSYLKHNNPLSSVCDNHDHEC